MARAKRIESVRTHPEDPRLAVVTVAGRTVALLPREVAIAMGLDEGAVWSAARKAAAMHHSSLVQAREHAFALLSQRDRSSEDLRARLARAGFDAEVVEDLIRSLIADGWLNDQRFARERIRSLRATRKEGRGRLAARLQAEGVGEGLAEQAVDEAVDADAELIDAREAIRLARRSGARGAKEMATRLARRGFSLDTIRSALSCEGLESGFLEES